MPKEILMNGLMTNTPVSAQAAGLWRHPEDTSLQHRTSSYWVDLARELERGFFDGIFLADTIGGNEVYGGSQDASLRTGVYLPRHDPMAVVPLLANATEHLGVAVTSNVLNTPPYLLARTFSTLDHLAGGRIGWNVVTGYLANGARAVGQELPQHDARYEIAEEYMSVVYRLWEQSWDDRAYMADRSSGQFADPAFIHTVQHEGAHLKMEGVHMVEPSPQRTPVIFQAGASSRGREFAGRHAEVVFLVSSEKNGIKRQVDSIRQAAVEQGREASDVRFSMLVTIVVAETDAEAEAKLAEYRRYASVEGSLSLLSGFTGIDLAQYAEDDPFPTDRKDAALHSAVEQFISDDPERVWTVGEVARLAAIGGRGPIVVGSPERVADELESWIDETGVDGFTLLSGVFPGGFTEFIRLVVPILQQRGRYRTEYPAGTWRERLFPGKAATPQAPHPAASYRNDQ